jgi:hypothetical protein
MQKYKILATKYGFFKYEKSIFGHHATLIIVKCDIFANDDSKTNKIATYMQKE